MLHRFLMPDLFSINAFNCKVKLFRLYLLLYRYHSMWFVFIGPQNTLLTTIVRKKITGDLSNLSLTECGCVLLLVLIFLFSTKTCLMIYDKSLGKQQAKLLDILELFYMYPTPHEFFFSTLF